MVGTERGEPIRLRRGRARVSKRGLDASAQRIIDRGFFAFQRTKAGTHDLAQRDVLTCRDALSRTLTLLAESDRYGLGRSYCHASDMTLSYAIGNGPAS